MKNYVFDIETVALPTDQLESIIPPFDPESVKTGQYGPEKAAEKIEKMRQEHFSRFYRRAALSAITGQIAMIGIRDEEGPIIWEGDEEIMIRGWLKMFEDGANRGDHWIGFNISNFDIPFIVRRAWFHGLKIPYGIARGRWLTNSFTDLLELWTGSERSAQFEVSLNNLAQFFGLGAKTANGADFGELLRYKPAEAKAYLETDLELTWKLAERIGALRGPPPEPGPLKPSGEPVPEEIRILHDQVEEIPSTIQFY